MRRAEAVVLVALALLLVVSGVTWLVGPIGLIGCGVVLAAAVLFLLDVKEE